MTPFRFSRELATKFKLFQYRNQSDRSEKSFHEVDIVGLAEHATRVREYYKDNPARRFGFSDSCNYWISNDGNKIMIKWAGLVDLSGRCLTDIIGFLTSEVWERRSQSTWECSNIYYTVPLDYVGDLVQAVEKSTHRELSDIVHTHVNKAVYEAVQYATQANLQTLSEIQSEKSIVQDQKSRLEEHLKRLEELETKAAEREAQKGDKKPRSLAGYVYVVKSLHPEPLYKIGRSNRPDKRTELFGIELPFDIETVCTIQTDDMYALESELHAKYADKRQRGEWFKLTVEDVEWIKSIRTDSG